MAERKLEKNKYMDGRMGHGGRLRVSGAQTKRLQATSYVNSASITLDVTPTVGNPLPDLLMWDTILITARYRSRTTINMISYPQSGLPQRMT